MSDPLTEEEKRFVIRARAALEEARQHGAQPASEAFVERCSAEIGIPRDGTQAKAVTEVAGVKKSLMALLLRRLLERPVNR